MTMFFVCIAIICLAILLTLLIFRAILRWWRGEPEPTPAPLPGVTEEIALEDLSLIWTIPIEDLEGGARWHYGHSEFFPERPAALRHSSRKWREENPRPRAPAKTATNYERAETPESREEAVKALQAILDSLSGKMSIPVWKVDDLVGSA